MLAWGYFQILFENALQGRLHIAQEGFSHVSRAKHEVLQQDSHDLKGKKVLCKAESQYVNDLFNWIQCGLRMFSSGSICVKLCFR